jgi:hypothetical protein
MPLVSEVVASRQREEELGGRIQRLDEEKRGHWEAVIARLRGQLSGIESAMTMMNEDL